MKIMSRLIICGSLMFVCGCEIISNSQVSSAYYDLSRMNIAAAKKKAELALRNNPKNAKAHLLFAQISLNEANFKIAVDEIKTAIRLDPTLVSGYADLASIHLFLGNYSDSLENANFFLNQFPNNHWALFIKARILGYNEQYNEAAEIYNKMMQLYPEAVDAVTSLVQIYWMQDKPDAAVALLEESFASGRQNSNLVMMLVRSYFDLSVINYRRNKEADGEKYLSRAISTGENYLLQNDDLVVRNYLSEMCRLAAKLYLGLNKPHVARPFLQKAIELKPDDAQLLFMISTMTDSGLTDDVRRKYLEKVISSAREMDMVDRREYVEAYFALGEIYKSEDKTDLAIGMYEQGLTIEPVNARRGYELAELYEKIGDVQKTLERFISVKKDDTADAALRQKARARLDTLNQPVKDYIKPAGTDVPTARMIHKATMFLLPISQDLPAEQLTLLRVAIEDRYGVLCRIMPPDKLPAGAYMSFRDQYDVEKVIAYIKDKYAEILNVSDNLGVIGLTSEDITSENANFLFATSLEKVAIISYHRFTSEFNEEEKNEKVQFRRVFTQILSTGGYVIGLPRCNRFPCARIYPHSLEEFDKKKSELCSICHLQAEQSLNKFDSTLWPEEDIDTLIELKKKWY